MRRLLCRVQLTGGRYADVFGEENLTSDDWKGIADAAAQTATRLGEEYKILLPHGVKICCRDVTELLNASEVISKGVHPDEIPKILDQIARQVAEFE